MKTLGQDIIDCYFLESDTGLPDEKVLPVICEDDDVDSPLLEAFLKLLNCDETVYYSRQQISHRRKKIRNEKLKMGMIVKKLDPSVVVNCHPGLQPMEQIVHWFELRNLDISASNRVWIEGQLRIYPIDFIDPESDADFYSAFYIRTGNQWTVWLGRKVTTEDECNIQVFIEQLVDSDPKKEGIDATQQSIVLQEVRIERQGIESCLFKKIYPFVRRDRPTSTRLSNSTETTTTPSDVVGESKLPDISDAAANKSHRRSISKATKTELSDDEEEIPDGRFFSPEKTENEDDEVFNDSLTPRTLNRGNIEQSSLNFYSFDWRGGVSSTSSDEDRNGKNAGSAQHESLSATYSLRYVTKEMLKMRVDKNIGMERRKEVIQKAADDPYSLVGWQVFNILY